VPSADTVFILGKLILFSMGAPQAPRTLVLSVRAKRHLNDAISIKMKQGYGD
jgi:hypothetical protein